MSKPVFNADGQIIDWRYSAEEVSRLAPGRKVQAPKDSPYYHGDGHDWYKLLPFSGTKTPWELGRPVERQYPKGFLEVFPFGPPVRGAGESGAPWRTEMARWNNTVETFVQAGWPMFPNALPSGPLGTPSVERLMEVDKHFAKYDMGPAVYHENIYGWWVSWPHSPIAHVSPWYMREADDAWEHPHHAIGWWQQHMNARGGGIPIGNLVDFARGEEQLNPTQPR